MVHLDPGATAGPPPQRQLHAGRGKKTKKEPQVPFQINLV